MLSGGMDPQDFLPVRFQFGGHFDYDGHDLHYIGGRVEMSYIERDKVSLPELTGFLANHVALTKEDNIDLHWLFLGTELGCGLRRLADDKTCLYMSDCTTEGGVAEIYVQIFRSDAGQQGGVNAGNQGLDQKDQNWAVYTKPSEDEETDDEEYIEEEESDQASGDDQQDSGDEQQDTTDYDEEASEFRMKARNQRRNPSRTGNDHIVSDLQLQEIVEEAHNLKDDEEHLVLDSSDECSYDDDDDGEAIRRKSRFERFDHEAVIPAFSLGMIFTGRVQFKDALIKYGLSTRRHLTFPKDEATRIRAKCSWKGCPWFIFASKHNDKFKVKTFHNVHNWPQRKDNRLVTASRIADKYEHIIKANPSWKLKNIKETVLLEMGVDVSFSKIKRAKAIVMRRMYETCKREYAKIFDYQAEILRSNLGSTCAVCLDPEYDFPVFQRIYVCFDACKRGFLAGCRRVIGVDGFF